MSSQDKMTQYTNFPLFSDLNSKIKTQTKQQKSFRNPIEMISDLNFNCQLPKQGDRRNYKTCWKCRVNDERLTGKKP